MDDIVKVRFDANEIAKSDDFIYGEDSAVNNLHSFVTALMEKSTSEDGILFGLTVQERSSPSMNVDITAGVASCYSTGEVAVTASLFGPVSVTNGAGSDRIDVLEVRLVETNFDNQSRAYKDPITESISYQNTDTKTRVELQAQVIAGTPGSGVAPAHTSGWIKLAEIFVAAGESTSILDADIRNVTAGYAGETNSTWTTETSATFKMKSVADLKTLFRVIHDEDGDIKDDAIKDNHIDFGTGAGEVNATDLPITDAGGRYTSTEVEGALQEIAGSGRTTETVKDNADSIVGLTPTVSSIASSNDYSALTKTTKIIANPTTGTITLGLFNGASSAGVVVLIQVIGTANQVNVEFVSNGTTDVILYPDEQAWAMWDGTIWQWYDRRTREENYVANITESMTLAENVTKGDPIGYYDSDKKTVKAQFRFITTQQTIDSLAAGHISSIALDNNRIVYAWRDSSTGNHELVVAEWNPSTGFGTLTTVQDMFTSATVNVGVKLANLSGNVFIGFALDQTANDDVYVRVFEYISGSSISYLSSDTSYATGLNLRGNDFCISNFGNNRFVIAYTQATGTQYVRIGEWTGATVNWLTSQTQQTANITNAPTITYIGDDKFILSYSDATNSDNRVVIGTYSGGSVTFSTPLTIDNTTNYDSAVVKSLNNKYNSVCLVSDNTATGYKLHNLKTSPNKTDLDVKPDTLSRAVAYRTPYECGVNNNDFISFAITGTDCDMIIAKYKDGMLSEVIRELDVFTPLAGSDERTSSLIYVGDNIFSYATIGNGNILYCKLFALPEFYGISDDTNTSGNTITVIKKGIVSGLSGIVTNKLYQANLQSGELDGLLYNETHCKGLSDTELLVV